MVIYNEHRNLFFYTSINRYHYFLVQNSYGVPYRQESILGYFLNKLFMQDSYQIYRYEIKYKDRHSEFPYKNIHKHIS